MHKKDERTFIPRPPVSTPVSPQSLDNSLVRQANERMNKDVVVVNDQMHGMSWYSFGGSSYPTGVSHMEREVGTERAAHNPGLRTKITGDRHGTLRISSKNMGVGNRIRMEARGRQVCISILDPGNNKGWDRGRHRSRWKKWSMFV